jgi:hypothetical protein
LHGNWKEITLDVRNSIALNECEQKQLAFQVQLLKGLFILDLFLLTFEVTLLLFALMHFRVLSFYT